MAIFTLIPINLDEANEFVANFHRHNKRVAGHKFAIAASHAELGLVGVAIVGRPVSRRLDDGYTAEVLRVCVRPDSPPHCGSFLYGATRRAWLALGGRRLITYTLQNESGVSLRAAGWRVVAELYPNTGKGWQTRPNREWQPVYGQMKFRWEAN